MPLFQTKQRPEDFVVTELLTEEPLGRWDFHYILLEKKWLTTFLLLDLMIKDFGLNRNMIGIAGLKDKHAITRQWISISKKDVARHIGGINDLLAWFRKKWKVINATYSDRMLKLGDNEGNQFDINLIPTIPVSAEQKQLIEDVLGSVEEKGIPNYFGEQRFGYGGNNWKIWYDLLAGKIRNIKGDKNTMTEKRFKVQAFASYVFNRYLDERIARGLLYEEIPGDIRSRGDEIVTGPMPGDDLKYASKEAGELEAAVFKAVWLKEEIMDRFKVYGLFGIRRPILVYPSNLSYSRRGKNLFLSFDLPSWAYATVLIDYLEKIIEKVAGPIKSDPKTEEKYTKRDKEYSYDKRDRKWDLEPKKKSPKKAIDPTINPYTGQKINQDKAKNRAQNKIQKAKKRQQLQNKNK